MNALAVTRRQLRVITSRTVRNIGSPDAVNAVTPVTLRPLTRCAEQGWGSTVTQ
jgi:hypothetical protein